MFLSMSTMFFALDMTVLQFCFPLRIGKHTSTKAANADEREDVTKNYKHEEGKLGENSCV